MSTLSQENYVMEIQVRPSHSTQEQGKKGECSEGKSAVDVGTRYYELLIRRY